jgi:hypothetical protein
LLISIEREGLSEPIKFEMNITRGNVSIDECLSLDSAYNHYAN